MFSKLFVLIIATVLISASSYFLIPSQPMPKPSKPRIIGQPPTNVSILLTGDIMLGRSVMTKSLGSDNPNYPFIKVADKLKTADFVFSNLESPIISDCPKTDGGMILCADPKMVKGLVFAGVDIVNLANNHILNYGQEGLNETKNILTENQIKWVGDDNLEIVEKDGIRFGFLGFDFVTKGPTENDYRFVQDSANKVDYLLVGIHWGKEYSDKATNTQKIIARKLFDAGADVIAGHHPHWIQDVEHIDGKPVYYSLGNFVFDQMWSEETRRGLAIKLTFQNNRLTKEDKLPIYMNNFAQPEWTN